MGVTNGSIGSSLLLLLAAASYGCLASRVVGGDESDAGLVDVGTDLFPEGPTLSVPSECYEAVAIEPGAYTLGVDIQRWAGLPTFPARELPTFDGPERTVRLDAPYWIGVSELTSECYEACVEAGSCSGELNYDFECPGRCAADAESIAPEEDYWAAPGFASYPVVGITHGDASSACAFLGGRLPSGDEWEMARRGPEGRISANGPVVCREFGCADAPGGPFQPDKAWGHQPVGWSLRGIAFTGQLIASSDTPSFPLPEFADEESWNDVTPLGIRHMDGNALEWTSDLYEPRLRSDEPVDDLPDVGVEYEVRGAGYAGTRIAPGYHTRRDLFSSATRGAGHPAYQIVIRASALPIGVRCVWDASPTD